MSADPKDVKIRELGIMTFSMALAQRSIGQEAEIVPLLKKVWNQAILSACLYNGCQSHLPEDCIENTLESLRVK